MGKNLAEVQSAELRIDKMTSAKKVVTTTETIAYAPGDLSPVNGDLADARDFNFAWNHDQHDTTTGLAFQVFDYMVPDAGNKLRDKLVFGYTGDWDPSRPGDNNIVDQIDTGARIPISADGIITWGFYDFRTKIGFNGNHEGKGYFPFTDAQKIAAQQSINDWDDLIAPDFQLMDFREHDASQWARGQGPEILLANTTSGPAQAWAYYPNQGHGAFLRASSDVWIGAATNNLTDLFDGGYGLTTQVHELGHTLGLSHPGDYNFGDDNDGDGIPDPITYEGDAFYFQDNRQYTTMSYFDSYEVGSNWIDWNLMRFMYSSTPMVDDVWVIQHAYGVETHTRTGDTTYGFNSTDDVTNSVMKFVTGERAPIFTIWDAAGNDTLNLSGYYTPSIIDLREGAYSSAGGLGAYNPDWVGAIPDDNLDAYLAFVNGNQLAAGYGTAEHPVTRTAALDLYFGGRAGVNEGVPWSDIVGRDFLMENNIGIAYGAIIENAIGGHGDDRINGNQANNRFTGGDGHDTFVIADYSGVIHRPTGDVNITDNSVDTITDFTTGVDTIDLTSFGAGAVSGLSYDGTDLHFSANGHAYTVHLLGAAVDLSNDVHLA